MSRRRRWATSSAIQPSTTRCWAAARCLCLCLRRGCIAGSIGRKRRRRLRRPSSSRRTSMRMILAAAALVALASCGPSKPDPAAEAMKAANIAAAETVKLTAYLDEQFEQELKESPERATTLGRKDNYDKMNDYSEAQQDKMLAWRQKSVADMKMQFDRARLDADGQMYYDIWALELDRAEKMQKFRRQALVFGRNAPHTERPSFLINYHLVSEVSDMEAYNSRVSQLGRVMDQSMERAK